MPDNTVELILEYKTKNEKELTEFKNGIRDISSEAEKGSTGGKKFGMSWADAAGALNVAQQVIGVAWGAMKKLSGAAAEAEVIDAQLEAVLRSTGGAAGLTKTELESLADEMSNLSGVDDDLIKRQEAVLLTFTRIGKETFPQATEAALNMSAALGQDLQSSIIQVGKALNEPIEGAAALRRVGVQLTDAQEKQIKSFMEMNDVASAQAVILQEFQVEFGGAAEAMGNTFKGAADRAKTAWGNLMEALGAGLNRDVKPVIETFTGMVNIVADNTDAYNVLRDAFEAGIITQTEWGSIIGQVRRGMTTYSEVLAENTYLSEQNSFAYSEASKWSAILADSQDDLAESGNAVAVSMSAVQEGIKSTITNAFDKYEDSLGDLSKKHDELTADLDFLNKYGWSPSRKSAEELTGAIDENEQAQLDAAAAMQETIDKMIFQRASADLDADATLELARAMGIMDEDSYNAAKAVDVLRKQFDDGTIDADEYAAKVAELSGKILGLQDKNVLITVDYLINTPTGIVLPPDMDIPHPEIRDRGGPVSAQTPYLIGLNRQPELFMPNTDGQIYPLNSGMMPLSGGGGGNTNITLVLQYSPTISTASQAEAENVLLPYMIQALRQAQADGLV